MRKLFLFFAALTLSAGLWAETVSYLCPVYNDPQDVTKGIQKWETKTADATEITNASATLAAGWYVVKGTDVQTGTLTCQGAVHIILADGAKLTATGWFDETDWIGYAGIQVSGGASLTIYAQSTDPVTMGQLIAIGVHYAAGIGGGYQGSGSDITINGGTITATGGDTGAGIGGGYQGSGSDITINGGTITATGGDNGAGIGGGQRGNGSNITINGGTVKATSEKFGAGIGGGGVYGSGSNITINGGEVTATGGLYAAGIGGGDDGLGSDITINGGVVTATGGDKGAGIGGGSGVSGGQSGNGSNITINGGTITATGGLDAAGIGGGWKSNGSTNITAAPYIILKANINNPPSTEITNNGGDLANDLAGKRYVTAIVSVIKANAIAEIELAIEGVTDADILAIANKAKENINKAAEEDIIAIKTQALADLATPIKYYNSGKAAGLAEAAAALPTDPEGTTGHAVVIMKGDKSVTLINPESVSYIKQE